MTGRRTSRFLRGLTSLVSILALLIGVPLLLAAWVGWPLPTSFPNLGSFEQAVRSGISDQVVVNTLAVVAWIAWAQLTLSLLVEVAAVARGRQTVSLPVLPGFQVTAARLIAGVLMVASTVQPGRVYAAPPAIPIVAEAMVGTAAPGVEPFAASVNGNTPTLIAHTSYPTTSLPVDHLTVAVERHDSYWAIAERTLGDGLRWREILDLNVGRTLPDGTTIAAGDDTLHTGWVLALPVDATVDSPAAATTQLPTAVVEKGEDLASVVVERGDNLWTISEDRLEVDLGREAVDPEVAPYWRDVIDANDDRFVQPGNPNLIYPGQVLVLPPTGYEQPAPATTEPPSSNDVAETDELSPAPAASEADIPVADDSAPTTTASQPTESEASTTPVKEPASVDTPADDLAGTTESANRAIPVGVAVGGLSSVALAVGLKRLLDRRRRRFANEHPGQLSGSTPPDQREFHQAIVAQADEERIDDLQGVLGRLAVSMAEAGSDRRPRIVRHSADCLEVLLDQPDTNAPAGWSSTEDGQVWSLGELPEIDESFDGPLSPAPLMVTIGQPEDDAQLYLDLEADGIVALTGDRDVATNLARSVVTELTLSPLTATLRVIAVGNVVDPDTQALDHLSIVETWDGLTDDLTAWADQSHDALMENGWANAFLGRGHEPDHDALVPVVVVADRPPPEELADALRAAQPSAVAVVIVGGFDGALASIRCEEESLNFDSLGLACSPQKLEADELSDISRILVAADSPAQQELVDQPQAEHVAPGSSNGSEPLPAYGEAADSDEAEPAVEQDEPPAYDILVRLLGDITVEGGKPLKPKATAVIAYIAVHRSVTTERLDEACWFGKDGISHVKRLRDTMTESRDALGSQHFPANRSGSYVAGPRVRTDLDLFDWHVQRAANLESTDAVEQYRSALDLVTGRPFSYPNAARASYGWVDFEHHTTSWELRVTGVTQACAALHLDLGEPSEAIAMLRRVVQVIPLNSALVEALMRAHLANNDCAGAESVYKEHAAALEQAKLGDPADSIEQLRLNLQT